MDLKIFSYITKDNFDNQFRCSVFKAYRKSKALFIVRTIGQAFEVCHRLQQESTEEAKEGDQSSQKVDEQVLADEGTDIDAADQDPDESKNENRMESMAPLVEVNQLLPPISEDGKTPFTTEQLRLLFNQQLEHYKQETEAFKASNQLLKDQLMLERNGRVQAQEREQCLLQKNYELLQTIQTLANRLQTVIPGDESLSAALNPTQDTPINPSYPSMHSTPHKNNPPRIGCALPIIAHEQLGIAGNSVVITPPADTIATFDPLASKQAPLATLDSITDPIQSTVGQQWKTFDEDEVNSPGSGLDTSSESSDDDNFSENFVGHKIIPPAERNGWVDLSEGGADESMKHAGNANSRVLGTSAVQQNGIIHNGEMDYLENNNNLSNTTDTRTAVQTDF